jgi:hypothetical protein
MQDEKSIRYSMAHEDIDTHFVLRSSAPGPGEHSRSAFRPDRPAYLSVANLKPGDAVIISFANSEDVSRVTAITLLAGVEPLLKTSTRGGQSINLGSWNLDLNMNVGVP